MPRGVPSAGSKQRNTKKAIREFKKWNEERYPIYDENNNPIQLQDDEVFVPVWDYCRRKKDTSGYYLIKVSGQKSYKKEKWNYKLKQGESYVIDPKFDHCYYISNYGNVISFKYKGTDQPLLMAHSEGTNGYMQVGDGWRSHKIVWFSFMADAIERLQKNPDAELPYELPLSYGQDLQTLNDLKLLIKLDDTEVHHRDSNVKNNALSNLEVLPNDVHDLLTDMKNTTDPEERWNKFLESDSMHYYDSKASIIVTDEDDVVAVAEEQEELWQQFSPETKQEVMNAYWISLSQYVMVETLKAVGYDFFNRDVYMAIIANGVVAFFKFERQDDRIAVSKLSEPIGIDFDIICDNGNIYLPNYTVE